MTSKISTAEVRLRIGDLLNRVALRGDEFVIERKGKPMAALVPVERLEQLRRAARKGLLEFLRAPSAGDPPEEEAMRLALEGQRWARGGKRGGGRRR
jgi:prevent-host-death family protein